MVAGEEEGKGCVCAAVVWCPGAESGDVSNIQKFESPVPRHRLLPTIDHLTDDWHRGVFVITPRVCGQGMCMWLDMMGNRDAHLGPCC